MNLKLPLLLGCCLFAAITACAETSASLDENAAGKKKADVYITTADRQQSFNHTSQKLSKTPAFASVVTLNPKVKFQEMDGFGAAVTVRSFLPKPFRIKMDWASAISAFP